VDIDALAALAGNTIVAAAVSDAFEGMRAAVARIFGRDKPDAVIQHRLDETRQRLATVAPGELESAHATQVRRWETRFLDFLADHPEAAGELSALVAELRSTLPDAGGNVTNTISGSVIGGSVLMGRDFGDITIGRRDDPPARG
jgi:hypothetical protein